MIDDLIEVAVLVSTDIAIEKASKRHRWARTLQALIALFLIAMFIGLIYITFKYS